MLGKNSTALHYFIHPPLNPQLRVHIFNYTNTERFLDGLDDKLIVKDVGPFVYTEKTQKVEVVYNDNNTISYRVNIIVVYLLEIDVTLINQMGNKKNKINYILN